MKALKILVVGSGAREHAIAWKLASSPSVAELFFAPGNAGTASLGQNVAIPSEDVGRLSGWAIDQGIDLVVVGPEAPLAQGLADRLAEAEGPNPPLCFGPGSGAARIESSKAFAKGFMDRWGIPTARHAVFTDPKRAGEFVRAAPWPFVIKASGLAAGKGVFLPDTTEEAEAILDSLFSGSLGEAGKEVVIEERLQGEEVSILGFCDGKTVRVMPPSQDHKRLLEGDKGPNTGGMGAVCSAKPRDLERAGELAELFLAPAVRGLAAEGHPFVGVLYAGLILTPEGPKALEFNCRFGDPETEAILPLLDSDLAEIMVACATGKLDRTEITWKDAASACVVLASEGYAVEGAGPDKGRVAEDFGGGSGDSAVFHAATRLDGNRIVAKGGRLLCVAAWSENLDRAVAGAYARLARLRLPESRYRRDIGEGRSFLELRGRPGADPRAASYASAGVDIDAGDKAVELMKAAVRSTYGPEVLAGIGAFGGVYDASLLSALKDPVLVASTDGVGTKVKLAAQAGSYASVGKDIVNHCIDDILVQGARPLFFLDYFATSKLDPRIVAEIVGGMADACRQAGCALIGGETAEMPGVYLAGEFDIAGTIVGLAERGSMLPRPNMEPGDVLLGFESSGLHTNGYSLARRVFEGEDLSAFSDELGMSLGQALLEPHRSYLPAVWHWLQGQPGTVKALAHITGGGFEGNIPRILPDDLDAVLDIRAWKVPPLFGLIMEKGNIAEEEMYRVFNMGIGLVAVVSASQADAVATSSPIPCTRIGMLAKGSGKARLERGSGKP